MAKRPKKQSNSRPARWERAFTKAEAAKTKLEEALEELNEAREELEEIRGEYEEWRDNLPENLQSSALYEKLDTIANIDLSSEVETPDMDWYDECEAPDFPLGFGRD